MSEPRVVARYMAAYVNGSWRCYATTDGIRKTFVGCAHRQPASAVAHRANLDPFVSPLPGVGPTSAPKPSTGAELLGLTPGRRETASAPARTPR